MKRVSQAIVSPEGQLGGLRGSRGRSRSGFGRRSRSVLRQVSRGASRSSGRAVAARGRAAAGCTGSSGLAAGRSRSTSAGAGVARSSAGRSTSRGAAARSTGSTAWSGAARAARGRTARSTAARSGVAVTAGTAATTSLSVVRSHEDRNSGHSQDRKVLKHRCHSSISSEMWKEPHGGVRAGTPARAVPPDQRPWRSAQSQSGGDESAG
jgi:hypothetical protein